MKNRNSLIADTSDLKYLFDVKEEKVNTAPKGEVRKYPKLKKRPSKTISS